MLDEQLLKEATRELGLKTYSATVNKALEEIVRIQKVRRLPELFGKVQWHGDLAEMREDNPKRPPAQRKSAAR